MDFRPLSSDTVNPLIDIEVTKDQRRFLASNAVTMAQSMFEPAVEIWGLFEDKTTLGMVALEDWMHPEADFDPEIDRDTLYLWRLMIDHQHQGKGYGTKALEFTLKRARELGRGRVVLTALDAPGTAIPLYEAFGFRRSGLVVDGDVELVLPL